MMMRCDRIAAQNSMCGDNVNVRILIQNYKKYIYNNAYTNKYVMVYIYKLIYNNLYIK